MDSFKTIASASSVTYSMVTEGRPVSDTRQHVVSSGGEVILPYLKDATAKKSISLSAISDGTKAITS